MKIKKRLSKGVYREWELIDNASIVNFINEALKPKYAWIYIGDKLLGFVNEIIESTETLSVKSWRSKYWSKWIIPYSKPTTYEFWEVRGYSNDHAKNFIKSRAKAAGNVFSEKQKINPENYLNRTPTQIGYWVSKGYTETDAINLVKERQSTFSLKKCIQKHGKDKGSLIFKQRQDKWLDSLNKSKNITWSDKDKDCRSLNHFNNLFHLSSIYLQYSFLSDDIRELYQYINDHNINEITDIMHWLKSMKFKDAHKLASLKPIQDITGFTKYDILEKYLELSNIKYKSSKWGRLYWVNGKYYQSLGELAIGAWLESNNIKFEMHKKYPTQEILFYDFYIPSYKLYIEYCGRDENVYKNKKRLLKNINVFWSNNVDEIIRHLKKY